MNIKNYAPAGRHLFYVLLTALLMGISGCGGGGGGTTTTPGGGSTGSTASGSAQ